MFVILVESVVLVSVVLVVECSYQSKQKNLQKQNNRSFIEVMAYLVKEVDDGLESDSVAPSSSNKN